MANTGAADFVAQLDADAVKASPPPAKAPVVAAAGSSAASDFVAGLDAQALKGGAQTDAPEPLSSQLPTTPEPTPEPAQEAPPAMAYGAPATLPMNGAPAMKPFESLPDIHNTGLMTRPQFPTYQQGYDGKAGFTDAVGARAPQYGEGSRTTKPGEIPYWQNAVKDLGDLGQGISSAMNASVLRGIHSLPEEIPTPEGILKVPGAQNQPLFGGVTGAADTITNEYSKLPGPVERAQALPRILGQVGQNAMHDPDLQALGAIGKGTADYYNDRYIQPFNPFNGGGPIEGMAAVRQQFAAHPISTLDLIGGGLGTAGGAGRMLTGKVGKIARATPHPSGYTLNGVKMAASKNVPQQIQALQSMGHHVTPINGYTTILQQHANKLAEMVDKVFEGINAKPRASTLPIKVMRDAPKNLASKVMLQSPTQTGWQSLQNSITFALGHIDSPRDLLYAGVGMMMAASGYKKWIPEKFFEGSAAPLLAAVPKWVTYLMLPDAWMNKHLEVVAMQDKYWRTAAIMTEAVKETMNVANPKQFQLLAETLQLNYWAQKNIKKLLSDPAISDEFLSRVNTSMGNYGKQLGALENGIAKNVMFYLALRHLTILTFNFPAGHPLKTSAMHALSTVMVKLAESEPMNSRTKAAGGALDRDKNGRLKLSTNGEPMVYVKGAGLTPFMSGIAAMTAVAKVLNREGLGDIEPVVSFAPFIQVAIGMFGFNVNRMGSPYKDPDSVSDGAGNQVKGWKIAAQKHGKYKVTSGDVQSHPQRPLEALILDAHIPGVYNAILQYEAKMQAIPGVPSEFATIGHPVPRRNAMTNKVIKPNEKSLLFNKLQSSEMSFDDKDEAKQFKAKWKKLNKNFVRKSKGRTWE